MRAQVLAAVVITANTRELQPWALMAGDACRGKRQEGSQPLHAQEGSEMQLAQCLWQVPVTKYMPKQL